MIAVEPADVGDGGTGLGEADRVLRLALRTWAPSGRAAGGAAGSAEGDPHARLLGRLEPSWARRVLAARDEAVDRPGARRRLREAHQAEARVDLGRVHPSWWARGLREESPSVRRAVVAAAPEATRRRLQSELLLDDDDLRAERRADPDVLAWARTLWTERLVGGEPCKADDPPVIAAMSGLSPRDGYRLCRYAGELKLAMAGQRRSGWADAFAASAGPEFLAVARHDIRLTPADRLPPRRLPARIGVLTIARLLAVGEPFRVRWALQHWPYGIAKLVRSLMPPDAKRTPVMMSVESAVLRACWDRLDGEPV